MIEDLGNIGDFLGGIGVVVTLAYLAIQIRKNTQSVRSAALDSLSTSISEFMDKVAQDPALTKLWFDGLSGTTDLPETEQQRFSLLLLSLFRRWENAFHQSRVGLLESASWAGMQEGLTFILSSPGARAWWESGRALFSQEFVAFADKSTAGMRDSGEPAA